MSEEPKVRKAPRSSINGRFVSKAYARRHPNTTTWDSLKTDKPLEGVKAQVMSLLEGLEAQGFELESVEIPDASEARPDGARFAVIVSMPVEFTFSKPEPMLDDVPVEEPDGR
jgi:hypothetical protein